RTSTPTSATCRAASLPPRSAGARTTAPARCGWSATGIRSGVENRVPGGDVNPYLAVAAMIAAGLHGIDNELPLEPPMTGNAYADTSARVPHTLHDALDLWEKSELAREAFGAEVVEHYANYARVELTA